TVLNDVSARDWQTRTTQFLAGKTFEAMTPVGPTMVTPDEVGDGTGLSIESRVDGEVKQSSNTEHLIFRPADLIADLSKIITLEPGDLIATGTPGGVGAGRSPQEWLSAGSELVTTISGVGELHNRCVSTP
ncbi:MAG: fumarylacetoacetate hydrolase family protein, partial [Acidimicrobiales bacterium]